jgi:putative transposase
MVSALDPRVTQHLANRMRYRRATVPGASYFFTLITYQRKPLFADPKNVERWHQAVSKVQRSRPFVVKAEVVMPDHLHMIWTLPEADADYATRIRLIKTAFTKDLPSRDGRVATNESRKSKRERDVWQRRYWEHVISDERDFHTHLDYIHANPVQHGHVARPGDWPHSTFGIWVERGVYDSWCGTDEMPPLPDWAGRE